MFFRRSNEKELKMIWEVEKDRKRSYLIGTAHFFPYSFKTSLRRCLDNVRIAMFEGPLDSESMASVVNHGTDSQSDYHIFTDLEPEIIGRITSELAPKCRGRNPFLVLNFRKFCIENPLNELVEGMKPWLAFFTIWTSYLKKNGWEYSVDLEGHTMAKELGKKIIFLETIEEQINVLENLSRDRIIDFLNQVDQWHILAHDYVKYYLAGDPGALQSKGLRFPSRHHSVINHRDRLFFKRMLKYLMQGDVAVFIGAPHINGVSKLLSENGFRLEGPSIPQVNN